MVTTLGREGRRRQWWRSVGWSAAAVGDDGSWRCRQRRLTTTEVGRRRWRAAWTRTVGGGRREERLWQGGTVVPIEKERAGGMAVVISGGQRRRLGRWSETEGQREEAVVVRGSTTTGWKKAVLAMEEAVTNEDGDGFTGVEGEVKRERREGRAEAATVLATFDDGGEGRGGHGGEASAVDGVRQPEGRSRERGREEGRWREAHGGGVVRGERRKAVGGIRLVEEPERRVMASGSWRWRGEKVRGARWRLRLAAVTERREQRR